MPWGFRLTGAFKEQVNPVRSQASSPDIPRCNACLLRGTEDISPVKWSCFSCTTPSCSCPASSNFYDLWRNKLAEKTSRLVQTCVMPLTLTASPWFFLATKSTTHQRARGWASATTLQVSWPCQSSRPRSLSPPLNRDQTAVVGHELHLNQFKLHWVQLGLCAGVYFTCPPLGPVKGK